MNASGALQGTIVVTNPSTTKIVSTKYITHTSSGTAGTGGRTWTFNWVAPVAGTGNVTFYGAFNFSNGNSQSNGDIIRTNTLTVSEDQGTAGISSVKADPFNTLLFPNPVFNDATLRLNLIDNSPVSIQYLDITGKIISEKITYNGRPGLQDFNITVPAQLETGIYRLLVSVGDQQSLKSFYKK
ncbi:MAG: T9SS type A sorting domain-containing protein [Bacteroidetes bacterium]|nr:T9SS type A sorting domain-containing protein [Bacteroidota bacterium]